MRLTRSMSYRFQSIDYEYISPMASVTVESIDLGVTPDMLVEFDDAGLDEHIKSLEELCEEMLNRQLAPLLKEADELCFSKSSVHDVVDYRTAIEQGA